MGPLGPYSSELGISCHACVFGVRRLGEDVCREHVQSNGSHQCVAQGRESVTGEMFPKYAWLASKETLILSRF